MELEIKVDGLAKANKKINEIIKSVDPKESKEILRSAAKILIATARSIAPKSKTTHYRYNTPKINSRLRAPNGTGVKVASYEPGNLSRSIQILPLKKLVKSIIIGPKTAKRNGTGKFSGRKVDGFYANMIEGGTKNITPNRFMERSWNTTRSTVTRKIASQLKLKLSKSS
jgi:HK97 gp10 family phage protein